MSRAQARPSRSRLPIQARVEPGFVRIPVSDGTGIRFSHVSLAQGLSQSRVTRIVQGNLGFLWFATQYGLDRYDGYRFKIYLHRPGDPRSLCGVYIYSLFKDRSGNIWVGCDNAVDRYDPATDSFRRFPILQGRRESPVSVRSIRQGPGGNLWLSTMDGLFRLDPHSGRVTRFGHDPDDPWSLSSSDVEYAADDREGHLWVATDKGLDEFDWRHARVLLHVPLHQTRGLGFFEDSHGVFWIYYASGNGLAVLDRRTDRLTRYSFVRHLPPGHSLTGVSSMLEDKAGTLWIGTFSDGLLRYERRDHRFIRYRHDPTRPASITEDRVSTLYEDREGSIWVGLGASPPCFFSTAKPSFRSLPFAASSARNLGERLVNAIFVDHAGRLWTGTTGSLNRFDPRSGRYRQFVLPGGDVAAGILSITENPRGTLWIGTSGQGVARLNERSGRFLLYRHRPGGRHGLSSNIVPALLASRGGRLWMATFDGLDELEPATGRLRVYRPGGRRAASQFVSLARGRNGSMWIGGRSGLWRFDIRTRRFTAYYHRRHRQDSLSNNRVTGIMIARSGAVWVSTQNGLDRLDPKTDHFTDYYTRDGLASNAVSCTLQDRRGDIWISTTDGLSRLDPRTGRIRNYGVGDALPGPDLTGWHACFRAPDGEMYFGGFSGAVEFRPARVTAGARIPPVVLTRFDLNGAPVALGPGSPLRRSIDYTRKIVLPYDENNFSFSYAALSFRDPMSNRYRYRLVGLDGTWHDVGADRRTASYTNLSPGEYRFEVQGATIRGGWSPVAGTMIDILRPWWHTWWFKVAVIIALMIANAAAYLLHIRRVARQLEIRFHERVAERAKIAQDLHDSLLQGFQGLMFSLQAVRKMLPAHPQEADQALERALTRGDESIAEARDAVRNLRSSRSGVDLIDTLKALGEEFGPHGEADAPSFRVIAEGKPRAISPFVQDEVHQISREALRNAQRHARAKHLEVEIIFGAPALTVRVRDDGVGLDREILQRGMRAGHWGLPGMRERAERVGGRLSLWSEMKAGTEIEIVVPANIAYRRPGERGNGPVPE